MSETVCYYKSVSKINPTLIALSYHPTKVNALHVYGMKMEKNY